MKERIIWPRKSPRTKKPSTNFYLFFYFLCHWHPQLFEKLLHTNVEFLSNGCLEPWAKILRPHLGSEKPRLTQVKLLTWPRVLKVVSARAEIQPDLKTLFVPCWNKMQSTTKADVSSTEHITFKYFCNNSFTIPIGYFMIYYHRTQFVKCVSLVHPDANCSCLKHYSCGVPGIVSGKRGQGGL